MPKVAVIIGDSQAQGAGATLQKRLQTDGYTVKRWGKAGANSEGVAALASSHATDAKDAELVVVFSGAIDSGSGGAVPAAVAVDKIWPDAKVVWYGSSPATLIGSLSAAQAIFAGVKTPDHWFPKTAADREKRNAAMPALLPPRFQYVDWRTLTLPDAVVQPSGVAFPTQADGIHVGGATATAAFSPPNWPVLPVGNAIAAESNGMAILAILIIVYLVLRK